MLEELSFFFFLFNFSYIREFNEIMFLRLSLELENSVYNVRECIAFAFKDAKSNSSSVFIVTG